MVSNFDTTYFKIGHHNPLGLTCLSLKVFFQVVQNCICNPSFQKEDPLHKRNYRPISILSVFSKVFKKYYFCHLQPFFDKVMSDYLSAYRPNYITRHVLLRLTEKWRNILNCNKVVGAVMMDLSKAFDCPPP